MKKILILIITSVSITLFHGDNIPSIILPDVDIEIEDIKNIDIEIELEDEIESEFNFEDIPVPDFTEEIKIDLEKTLPENVLFTKEKNPIDALILFGYGLNNNMYADFSIYIKRFNPKVWISYKRYAKDTLWFDRKDSDNSYSMDDFKSNLVYNFKSFALGAELSYFNNSYGLQDQSCYDSLSKRILNIDIGPSLKFKYQNDITLRVQNSLLFYNNKGAINSIDLKRDDFDYLLKTDIIYSQILGKNHFIKAHTGYDFSFFYSLKEGKLNTFNEKYSDYYFNNIKVGVSYSTTFIDSFHLKGNLEFLGTFRDYDFFWYIIPMAQFGYSFKDFFHCFVEGGADLIEKPDNYWFQSSNYTIMPVSITPGYHWYAKTGIKGAFTLWFELYTNLEFAYNMDGFNYEQTDSTENLFSLTKENYFELNLSTGLVFTFREYISLKVEYLHYFLEKQRFDAQDNLLCNLQFNIPKIGLTGFIDFEMKLVRFDYENNVMNNIYLMNAGIDWSYLERLGAGVKFNNIIYFQNHQIIPGYDEPGFEFIVYLKVGF